MKYYAIPVKNVEGLTLGKLYKVSDYVIRHGQILILNEKGKMFSFGIYDYRIKVVSEDELSCQNLLKELIIKYEQKSEDCYDSDCAYLIYEQIIDDLENIVNR